MREYEEHRFQLPRTTDRRGAQTIFSLQAEFGGWELARHRIYPDGTRWVTLRRPRRPDPTPAPTP